MRKKQLIIMFLIIFAFAFTKVDAATCSNLTDLKTEASLIEVNYELVKPHAGDNGDMEESLYGYDLYISNVSDNFEIRIGGIYYSSKDAKNGTLYLKEALQYGGYTTTVEVYGTEKSGCKDYKIRGISVKLPRYNRFSEYEECIGHTAEYPICYPDANTEKYYDETFKEEVSKQAIKYEEKQKKKNKKENNNTKKKNVFELYLDNAGITVPITILIVVVIAGIIYKVIVDDKKKVKIDLGVKKNVKKRRK